jgi:transcriptional regulator with XRE-family HTH domain
LPPAAARVAASQDGTPQSPQAANIDYHVSTRIRERRIMLGLTQQELAQQIGVTYQQEHKYERGTDRISAERLFRIAEALGVSVDFFYEDIGEPQMSLGPRERRVLEMVRVFAEIPDPALQEAVATLARLLAGSR